MIYFRKCFLKKNIVSSHRSLSGSCPCRHLVYILRLALVLMLYTIYILLTCQQQIPTRDPLTFLSTLHASVYRKHCEGRSSLVKADPGGRISPAQVSHIFTIFEGTTLQGYLNPICHFFLNKNWRTQVCFFFKRTN